jgi:flagellar assembly protein FliH
LFKLNGIKSSNAAVNRQENVRELHADRVVRPVSFSFADLRGQANEYLDTVRQAAAKIVQQAHQDAERIRRHAEVAGRKAAEAAAERVLEDKVAKRMQTILPALEQLVNQLQDAKGDLLRDWERSALHVITAIAERVIRRQLIAEPQIALSLIEESLQLAVGAIEITLRVNPADLENLGPQIQQLAAALCRLAPSQIIPDAEEISAGGCRVETRFGAIDNQIESQLQRIEQDLD